MNKETGLSAIYAKNITPLVKGDEVKWYRNGTWINATVKNEKVNTIYPGQLHTNKGIFSDVELSEYGVFVVSFANRPNTTGKQPVADDVVVDTPKTLGGPRAASELRWARIGIIPTWKPNHESMLAKFKEQGANTMNEQEHKAKSHEVALMTNALDDNPDEQVIEPWVGDHITDKPVFTQEMAKAKQLAPIGSKITYHTSPRDDEGVTATVIGHHNEWMWILTDSGRFDQITMDVTFSFPDNRTDEQRAVDDLIEIMQSNEHTYPEIIGLIKDGKIHGVKWIIE